MRFLDEIRMMTLDLGKYRFGRNEHDGAIGSHVRDDVFRRDVPDVFADVDLELAFGLPAFQLALRNVGHPPVSLQRKFGVDRQCAGRGRQEQHAVGDPAVRQAVLQAETCFGHHVADQRRELHFAEGATRTLVGQHLLQADHVTGQRGNLLLRLVDQGETLEHVGEGCGRLLEAIGEPPVDLPSDVFQALVGRARQRVDPLAEFGRAALQGLGDLALDIRKTQLQGLRLALRAFGLALLERGTVSIHCRLHLLTQAAELFRERRALRAETAHDRKTGRLTALEHLLAQRRGIGRLPLLGRARQFGEHV